MARRTNTKALGIKIAQRQKQKDRVTERDYKEGEKEAVKAAGGYLVGGQAKLDKNKNNRIDAEDFKILRGEKKKPGKMMKARRGTIIKPRGPGVIRPKPQDRYGQPMKPKPIKPRIQKKMGGGMMKKVHGYKKGSLNQGPFSIGPFKPKPGGLKPSLDDYDQMKRKRKKMGGGLMEATQRLKAQGKMGGGMMMRPNPVGMKSGKSVKVKCKLGRNKPTKMY